MVIKALDVSGRLDGIALNAALMGVRGSLLEMPISDVKRLMAVNFYGALYGLRACVPALSAGASIVVTGALAGMRGDPRIWAYGASKAALLNLVQSAAVDLGQRGLRVNAVVPGPVRGTAATANASRRGSYVEELAASIPMQRWGEPSELASVAQFLLSPGSGYVNGSLITVDGGAHAMLPWYRPGGGGYLRGDS